MKHTDQYEHFLLKNKINQNMLYVLYPKEKTSAP